VADERPEDARELTRRIQEIVEIGEAVSLLGVVMDGLVRLSRGRRVDADAVLQEVPHDEVVEPSDLAAVFRARIDPRMAASVHSDVPARVQGPALGLHVDDARSSETELCGQRTRDEIDGARQARAQAAVLPKETHAVRERYAVYPVLHVPVLVADVVRASLC
jgi:hypothetical protein